MTGWIPWLIGSALWPFAYAATKAPTVATGLALVAYGAALAWVAS